MSDNIEEDHKERDIRDLDKKRMAELLNDLIDENDESAESDSRPNKPTDGQ